MGDLVHKVVFVGRVGLVVGSVGTVAIVPFIRIPVVLTVESPLVIKLPGPFVSLGFRPTIAEVISILGICATSNVVFPLPPDVFVPAMTYADLVFEMTIIVVRALLFLGGWSFAQPLLHDVRIW